MKPIKKIEMCAFDKSNRNGIEIVSQFVYECFSEKQEDGIRQEMLKDYQYLAKKHPKCIIQIDYKQTFHPRKIEEVEGIL